MLPAVLQRSHVDWSCMKGASKSEHISLRLECKASKRKKTKHCDTGASRAIPQRTTGPAQPSLTSVIGREPVLYGWYDRSMSELRIYV